MSAEELTFSVLDDLLKSPLCITSLLSPGILNSIDGQHAARVPAPTATAATAAAGAPVPDAAAAAHPIEFSYEVIQDTTQKIEQLLQTFVCYQREFQFVQHIQGKLQDIHSSLQATLATFPPGATTKLPAPAPEPAPEPALAPALAPLDRVKYEYDDTTCTVKQEAFDRKHRPFSRMTTMMEEEWMPPDVKYRPYSRRRDRIHKTSASTYEDESPVLVKSGKVEKYFCDRIFSQFNNIFLNGSRAGIFRKDGRNDIALSSILFQSIFWKAEHEHFTLLYLFSAFGELLCYVSSDKKGRTDLTSNASTRMRTRLNFSFVPNASSKLTDSKKAMLANYAEIYEFGKAMADYMISNASLRSMSDEDMRISWRLEALTFLHRHAIHTSFGGHQQNFEGMCSELEPKNVFKIFMVCSEAMTMTNMVSMFPQSPEDAVHIQKVAFENLENLRFLPDFRI
jgi:hypothetical protein